MGQFKIKVTAIGGHGCKRSVRNGEITEGCGSPTCPDCITRNFISELKKIGCSVEDASLIHWPGTPSEVIDNLVTGVRTGNF